MTPEMQTFYSVSLFLSLAALTIWSGRRQRRSTAAPVPPDNRSDN